MLITEKQPAVRIYPQITQAPINYFDFLNFFRGGHTIDDNLGATSIAETLQANLLKAAIKSGHLRKTKNMAMPNESLADIFLTELGAEQLMTPQNGQQLMEGKKSEWERVNKDPLGEGGQSKVYLVRTPERTKQRRRSLEVIKSQLPISVGTEESISSRNLEYVEAIRDYTRPELPEELGAMKEFKIRDDEEQSLSRLKQEIEVLQQNLPGLPKLLGFDMKERWMVTEFFRNGTLEDHLLEYRGNAALALKAFRSVVATSLSFTTKAKFTVTSSQRTSSSARSMSLFSVTSGWSMSQTARRVSPVFKGKPWELVTSSLRRRGEAWAPGLRRLRLTSTCTCSAKFFGAWWPVNPSSIANFGMSPRTT